MKWIVIIIVVIVALIAIVYLVGYFMPVAHRSSITLKLNTPPRTVWEIITNTKGYQAWRKDLKNVIYTDPTHWTEVSGNGTIHYELEVMKPNELFVSRITNKDLPFGGAWTFELAPEENGTRLTITENGEVYNPVFRFMSKYIFGHEATLRQYTDDLANHINKK